MKALNAQALTPEVRRVIAQIAAISGVTVCTSTTRPSPPKVGQSILESDTGILRVWDGAAWRAPVAVWA